MKLVGPTLALAALSLLCTPRALAGEHQTQLASCLVQATTTQDREALVQWIFVAMASHPMARELAAVPADKRKAIWVWCSPASARGVHNKSSADSANVEPKRFMRPLSLRPDGSLGVSGACRRPASPGCCRALNQR